MSQHLPSTSNPNRLRRLVRVASCVILLCGSSVLRAADDWNVLTGTPEDPPAGRLYKWMQGQAGVLFDRRRQAVAALKTPADVHARQQKLRQQLIEALGACPCKG